MGFSIRYGKKARERVSLEAENRELKEKIKDLESGHFCPQPQLSKLASTCDCAHSDKHRALDWAAIDKLDAENEQYREALEKIQAWAHAYPLSVFPKPDLKKAHKALKAAGMTLDAISADAMRHVLDGVIKIIEQALKDCNG